MATQNLVKYSENVSLWTLSGVSAALDSSVIAPDGSVGSVSLVTATTGGVTNHFAEVINTAMPYFALVLGIGSAAFAINGNRQKSSSVWVKAGTTTRVVVGNGRHSNWYRALFNLSLGVVDTEENCTGYIEPGPNGWFRCTVIYIINPTEANIVQDSVVVAPVPTTQTGTASIAYSQSSETVYVWGAQLAITNGPTHYSKTGAQDNPAPAPRAVVYQNLVTYNEDLTVGAWFKESAAVTLTAGVAGNAPDGVSTPTRVQWTSGSLRYVGETLTFYKRVYTISAWVRSLTGTNQTFRFRLPLTPGSSNQDSSTLTAPANGKWVRVSYTAELTGAGTSTFLIETDASNNSVDIEVWGVQLTESASEAPYVKTLSKILQTRGPRGAIGERNALVSSQALHSDTTNWVAIGSPTRSASPLMAPDGTYTASRLTDTSAVAYEGVYQNRSCNADVRSYVFSIYVAKTVGAPNVSLTANFLGGTTVSEILRFDPNTGLFVGTTRAGVEDCETWWRIWIRATNNSTNTQIQMNVYPAGGLTLGGGLDVSATGTADVWGAQISEGNNLVPYAFTEGSAKTGRVGRGKMGSQNLLYSSQDIHSDTTNWVSVNSPTRAASPVVAPDGTLTASRIGDSSAAVFQSIRQQRTISRDAKSYVFSVFVAKTTGATAPCGFNFNVQGGTTVAMSFRIDTSTGAWSSGGVVGGVIDYGDWWRVWARVVNNGTNTLASIEFYPATGATFLGGDNVAGVGTVDIWGAQLVEATSHTPYVRSYAAAATSEDPPRRFFPKQNVAPGSDMMTGWTIANSNRSVQPTVVSPTGNIPILFTEDSTAAAVHYLTQTIIALGTGRLCTMSFFVKRAVGTRQFIACAGNGGNSALWFDITNGTRGTGGGGVVASSIEPAGNGWFKITISWTQTSGLEVVRIYHADADGSVTFNGDGSSGWYIADAQVVEGYGAPQEIVQTRNVPAGSEAQPYDRGPRGAWI